MNGSDVESCRDSHHHADHAGGRRTRHYIARKQTKNRHIQCTDWRGLAWRKKELGSYRLIQNSTRRISFAEDQLLGFEDYSKNH